jgi:hypothetical protein
MTAMNAPSAADRKRLHRRRAAPLVGGCIVSLLTGCSALVDSERGQCSSDADCSGHGEALVAGMCLQGLCATRPEWSCATGAVGTGAGPSGSVDVTVPLRDLLGQPSHGALEARLCHKVDVNCEVPEQIPMPSDAGEVALTLDSDFEGYLSVTGSSLIPTLYFLSPPLRSGERLPALTLMSPGLMESLALEMDVALMGARGHAQFSIEDCNAAPSPGVSLEAREADAETTRFYSIDGLPDTWARSTSSDGVGGFLNAPTGGLTVSARWGDDGATLGSASVLIRPGFISYGRLSPVHLSGADF